MWFRILILLTLGLTSFSACAQEDAAQKYAEYITAFDMQKELIVLASEGFEGRKTGERGQKMAALYIQDFFIENGVEPIVPTNLGKRYFQHFELENSTIEEVTIHTAKGSLMNNKQFLAIQQNDLFSMKNVPIVWGGLDPTTLPSLEGKSVIVKVADDKKGYQALRSEETELMIQKCREMGVKAIFFQVSETVFQDISKLFSRYSNAGSPQLRINSPNPISVFLVNPSSAAFLLGMEEGAYKAALKTSKVSEKASPNAQFDVEVKKQVQMVSTENVLGYIEGSDKKDEVLVISAHYDHLGMKSGKIYYGADDNASGTVGIMMIAKAFAKAKEMGHGPRRSILFLALTAEEQGLIGSEYYSDHDPVIPIKQIVANLNIDMIGREDPSGKFSNENHVCTVGSDWLSKDLHQVHEEANKKYAGLEIDYTYNSKEHPEKFYYRSDQYNFAKKGIPVIFYTSGDHPDYHTPNDTSNKILFNRMEKVARLIYYTAWEIVNREERLKVDKTTP